MILAHAFGQRYDLPVPLLLFVLGGAAVVVLSFVLVAPRAVTSAPAEPGDGSGEDEVTLRPAHPWWGWLSVAGLAVLIWCGRAGSQEVAENIVPTVFWLIVWIAVPLSCGLIGDWTQPVNPFAFLARVADRPGLRRVLLAGSEPVRWPAWLGWWPAVVLFFVTACGELVFNVTATVPRATALALACYALVSVVGGLLFGPAWLQRGELFTVLFATWGRLGYLRFGAPGRRGFAGGLQVPFAAAPSRITFVLLLLVSVNFDGLLATPSWTRLERRLPGDLAEHSARLETFRTGSFMFLALAVAAAFGVFALAAARAARAAGPGPRDGSGFTRSLADLLPTLMPIAFGYLLVHNLEYLVINSQLLLPLLGNPVGQDWWPIHLPYPFNDDYEPHVNLVPTSVYWYASVLVIVAVHVVAVVLAHHRLAGEAGDARAARASEYRWLVAMVGYTMASLWLIAQPLVQETPSDTPSAAPVPRAAGPAAAGYGPTTARE
ncbi:MAG: hypothetical protein V7637_3882 [Mycobacteriales bacterium]